MWTPWFGVLGSKSGFDSLEECFGDYVKYIYAGETGLSSDPPMNWRVSELDRIVLLSNSDAHSPEKIGREANVFDADFSYKAVMEAIRAKDPKKLLYTIEFFPEEGKYHYDGHRVCGVRCSPEETKKYNGICPVCGKPLVVGVMNRVEELADREKGFRPERAIPFKSLIPLKEVIASVLGVGSQAKIVEKEYNRLIGSFGNEFKVLLDVSGEELKETVSFDIAEAIVRVRQGDVKLEPGYDGVFGKILISPNQKTGDAKDPAPAQNTLF
ncbi:MAG TPA: DNA helicase UvrD, partial [Candidatus Parcubacteria bacterium]|nr:DNA helicase UvrD [Candidatus Parcubacteria bacterium]